MEELDILVIDTSSDILKIGLSISDKEVSSDMAFGYKHVENLLPAVESGLKKIKENKSKIKFIGVCSGPGSFTGIRIGIASALGLSYGQDIACFGFSIFDVYKFLLKDEKNTIIVPVIDAKKNRFYCSFIENDKPFEMYDISLPEIVDKLKKMNAGNKKIIFAGKDFSLIRDEIVKHFEFQEKYVENYTAKDILEFATWLVKSTEQGNSGKERTTGKQGGATPCLTPPKAIYLRKSEAELALGNKK